MSDGPISDERKDFFCKNTVISICYTLNKTPPNRVTLMLP